MKNNLLFLSPPKTVRPIVSYGAIKDWGLTEKPDLPTFSELQ
jgi:hypothetical protein